MHRHQCGLEFHIPRFLASLSLPADKGPHPALIDAMCLTGCALSRKPHLRKHEPYLLAQTRKHLEQSLSQADRLLDFIRASGLVTRYYAFRARFLEGHTSIETCAKFTIACGLHKIKSRVCGSHAVWDGSPSKVMLPPPADDIEVGERIYAFWQIFMVERMVSASGGIPSIFENEVGIVLY